MTVTAHPDFAALWAGVLAAPADAAPQLIAADWLADHGADPDLEAGLRLCARLGIFPHKTTQGSWLPRFPWRWGTVRWSDDQPWPPRAIPPESLLYYLVPAIGPPGTSFNRTVSDSPEQLVRWLAWADAGAGIPLPSHVSTK